MDPDGRATPRRRYRMGRRLDRVADTKKRITAAAFELHAELGPARTTVSAIAARAGVQRRTVAAHFPDLGSLYEACTAYGIEAMGMPDPEDWLAHDDARDRLRQGLEELYRWYGTNARLLANLLGDEEPADPSEDAHPDPFTFRMIRAFEILGSGWPNAMGDRRFGAVLEHALAFETWRSLTNGGLTPREAVELMVDLVGRTGAADPGGVVSPEGFEPST